MIDERFPTPADRGLECLKALHAGVELELNAPGTAYVARCGCGHAIASTTRAGCVDAIRDHFTRQVEQ